MAVSYAVLNQLRESPAFVGRVRIAVINYAVYVWNLRNSVDPPPPTAAQLNWSNEVRNGASAVEQWTQYMLPYVLINVAAGSNATGSGDSLDIEAADSAMSGEVEAQINARFA
jgi:hypothetical protein